MTKHSNRLKKRVEMDDDKVVFVCILFYDHFLCFVLLFCVWKSGSLLLLFSQKLNSQPFGGLTFDTDYMVRVVPFPSLMNESFFPPSFLRTNCESFNTGTRILPVQPSDNRTGRTPSAQPPD